MKILLVASTLWLGTLLGSGEEVCVEQAIKDAKLDLWSRGAYALDEAALFGDDPSVQLEQMNLYRSMAPIRLGPVKKTRRSREDDKHCEGDWKCLIQGIRGGAEASFQQRQDATIEEKGKVLGSAFLEAIEQVRLYKKCKYDLLTHLILSIEEQEGA